MYEYVSDVLRAMKIDPKDVMLIRHAPRNKGFKVAQEAGFIKEYTAMQETGFARDKEHLMVFVGEPPTKGRFFALYHIANRFQTRAGHVPDGYPNRSEETAEGDYLELREEEPPEGLKGFTIEWGTATRRWYQHAIRDKRIIEAEIETGGARE